MGLVHTNCRDSFALGELSSITGGRAGLYRSFFVAWGVVPNSQKLANTDAKEDDSTGPVVLAENARQAGHACGPVYSATEAPRGKRLSLRADFPERTAFGTLGSPTEGAP